MSDKSKVEAVSSKSTHVSGANVSAKSDSHATRHGHKADHAHKADHSHKADHVGKKSDAHGSAKSHHEKSSARATEEDGFKASADLEDEMDEAQAKREAEEARQAKEAEEREMQQHIEALQKQMEALRKKAEAQQKAGDEDGARATLTELQGVQSQLKQLIEANQPSAVNPVQGVPAAGGAPMGGAPMGGAPMGGAPMGGAPMGGAPMGGAPMGGAPMGGAGQIDPMMMLAAMMGAGSLLGGGGAQGLDGAGPANPSVEIPSSGPNPTKQQTASMLDAAAEKYGVPQNLLRAIAFKESGWDASAVGDGGKSHGMMQINSAAHPDYDVARGKADPSYNIEYGARFLADLHKESGDWHTAARRYNGAGPAAEAYANSVTQIAQTQPWKQWGV